MNIIPTAIADLLIIEPKVFGDERGFFFESFNQRRFAELTGIDAEFVQDNHSKSARHVLRGLHYQIQHPQGKLVRVVAGEVFDVAVDIRKSSPTFGQWVGVNLSPRTSACYGYHPDSHTASSFSATRRNSSTRRQITGRQNSSVASSGTM